MHLSRYMFLFSELTLVSFSQSHFKSLLVLPDKTGLHSLRHSLDTCHATHLTVMLFHSDTPPPSLIHRVKQIKLQNST